MKKHQGRHNNTRVTKTEVHTDFPCPTDATVCSSAGENAQPSTGDVWPFMVSDMLPSSPRSHTCVIGRLTWLSRTNSHRTVNPRQEVPEYAQRNLARFDKRQTFFEATIFNIFVRSFSDLWRTFLQSGMKRTSKRLNCLKPLDWVT